MLPTEYQRQLEVYPNTTSGLGKAARTYEAWNVLGCRASSDLRPNNSKPTRSLAFRSLLPGSSYCAGRDVLHLDELLDREYHTRRFRGMRVVHRLHAPSKTERGKCSLDALPKRDPGAPQGDTKVRVWLYSGRSAWWRGGESSHSAGGCGPIVC